MRPVCEPRDVKLLRLVDLDWGSLMDVIVFFTAASEGNCIFSDVLLILGGHIY